MLDSNPKASTIDLNGNFLNDVVKKYLLYAYCGINLGICATAVQTEVQRVKFINTRRFEVKVK